MTSLIIVMLLFFASPFKSSKHFRGETRQNKIHFGPPKSKHALVNTVVHSTLPYLIFDGDSYELVPLESSPDELLPYFGDTAVPKFWAYYNWGYWYTALFHTRTSNTWMYLIYWYTKNFITPLLLFWYKIV